MMRVQAAGQRAEGRHDDLARRHDEAAARHLPAAQMNAQLGMEMAGDFRPRLVANGFVAEDDSAELDLVRDAAAAMVGEARIVVADDPGPVELRGEFGQQFARARRQPIAAEAVVEAVAEAIEARRAGALDLGGERGQRRMRIVGRQELPEPREPARLFKVQVGDQQRLLGGPVTARRQAVATNVSPANEKGTISQSLRGTQ